MVRPWQDIPESILRDEQAMLDAENWAKQQRAQLAGEWAQTQLTNFQQWVRQQSAQSGLGLPTAAEIRQAGNRGSLQPRQSAGMGDLRAAERGGVTVQERAAMAPSIQTEGQPIDFARGEQENEYYRRNLPGYAGAADVIGAALEMADRPRNALMSAAYQITQEAGVPQSIDIESMPDLGAAGERVLQAGLEGLRGERHTMAADVLKGAGVADETLANVLGFGLDLVADPVNYIPGAALTKPGRAAIGATGRAVSRVGQAAGDVVGRGVRAMGEAATSPAVRRALPGLTVETVERPTATRMYHGTANAFEKIDPEQLDPNALYGPGYYLTTNADVASSYATNRAWDSADGANVRAVNVPSDLKLLDAEAELSHSEIVQTLSRALSEDNPDLIQIKRLPQTIKEYSQSPETYTGDTLWTWLVNGLARERTGQHGVIGAADTRRANQVLAELGYDGIKHRGGLRRPMRDSAGNRVRHDVVVIFPESLPKIRNAISGTQGGQIRPGMALDLASTTGGGVAGYNVDPNATPEERIRNAALGAAGGFGTGRLAQSGLARRLTPGLTVQDVSKAAGEGGEQAARAARQSAGQVPPGQTRVGVDMSPLPERPGFAGNIRLEKYPEEVRPSIEAWAKAHPDEVQQARRGVRTDEQVMADARALVEETGGNWEKVQKRWKPGQAWNAEEIQALRGTLRTKAEELVVAQRAARQSDSTENLLKLRMALEEHSALQEIAHGVTAEAGRSLRAFRKHVDEALVSGDTARMEKLLRYMGGRDNAQQMADALARIDLDNPDAIYSFVRNVTKPKMSDYATELYYNSILSGPKTHLVNAISNAVTSVSAPVERAAAAAVDVGLSRLQGRARTRFFSEAGAEVAGLRLALPEATRGLLYTIKHGFTPDAASRLEFRPKAFTGRTGRIINAPSTALEASDAFFSVLNQRAAMHAEALRMAKGNADEAADLLLNPTPELMAKASDVSEYRLFRQDVGSGMQKLMSMRNEWPALRFVIPFVQTPTNLLKYGLERSPAGWLNPNLWKNLASKSPEAADQIARAGVGSMLAAGIAAYAADGKITGAPPVNAAERDRFYREGKQPYAIKIGDQWISYQRLEPLNQAFSQVASAVNAINAGDDKGAAEIAMQAGADIGRNLLSQTFVTGLNDAINAIDDPGRYAEQFAGRMASSMVPFSALTRTVAQATDPTIRQPENIPERIASNLPVLSQTVPARLTAFGEPSQREVGAINPYTHSQEKTDPLTQELNRLQYNTGFVGDSISNVPLNRAQQRQYQELAGQLTKRLFERLMQKDAYQQLDDSQRIEVLDKLTAEARKIARDTVLDQMIEGRLQERDAAGVR